MNNRDKSASEPPRTNAGLREEAIRRMLDVAVQMIAERGAARLSLVDVGRRAGYSHSLPNYYFKSKAGLLTTLYASVIQRATASIIAAAKASAPRGLRPGLQNILATVRAYLQLNGIDRETTSAMHALQAEAMTSMPEMAPTVREQYRKLLEFFDTELRTAIARGEIDPDLDVSAMSVLIASLLRGSVALWRLDPESVDLDRLSALVCQTLTRAWSVPMSNAAGPDLTQSAGAPL